MKLSLYNSLKNTIEEFIPIDVGHVRMYVCGPTVYSSPHIGNARPIVIFDILYRVLQILYPKVTYVRNITDVDDKINAKSKQLNISIGELTEKIIQEFHKNIAHLNVLSPTIEPRATNHINEILEFIKLLIRNGCAYQASSHVLFKIKSLDNYGILSKRDLDDMIAGSRIEVAPYKEHPMDFVLWKPSEDGDPFWDSEFGKGRPGWHIECSAMSNKYLGKTFDIHGGGQDLMFPHHENEIAQHFGAFSCLMANYWIHNGMLLVNGQKMSKSLGNVIAINDILQQLNGEVIRYVLLSTHYQKTLNWTDTLVAQAKKSLDRLYGALKLHSDIKKLQQNTENTGFVYEESKIFQALCNNLNTPLALTELHCLADKIYKSTSKEEIDTMCLELVLCAKVLGILQNDALSWFKSNTLIDETAILSMIEERKKAKIAKNYKRADEIRTQLSNMGIQIEDTANETIWRSI